MKTAPLLHDAAALGAALAGDQGAMPPMLLAVRCGDPRMHRDGVPTVGFPALPGVDAPERRKPKGGKL